MILRDSALKAALEALIASERLRPGRGYGKAELLRVLEGGLGGAAEAAFTKIRTAAGTTGNVAGVFVRAEGERRGCRYFFGAAGEMPLSAKPMTAQVSNKTGESTPPTKRYVTPAAPKERGSIEVHAGDNLSIISKFPGCSFDLIYIDPPFNTGRTQSRTQISTVRDDEGDRVGFKGRRYLTKKIGTKAFADTFDDYLEFLAPRLEQANRLLKPKGSLFLHLDFREVHYAKVLLDQIFGRDCFVNEIIWAYDYGARATRRWSPKHDNILWYSKSPDEYLFNYDEIDRIPYMAPGLVGEEKAARGKTPTDTWWHTIVSPNGHEKTGYPTQKPLGVLKRIVAVHSNPGDRLLDFFAGSGTLGEAGASLGRDVVLVDENPEAIEVMQRRLRAYEPTFHGFASESFEREEATTSTDTLPTAEVETQVLSDVGTDESRAKCVAANLESASGRQQARVTPRTTSTQARLFE